MFKVVKTFGTCQPSFPIVTRGIILSGVRSTYSFTAGIILFKKCDFDHCPPAASVHVNEWLTLVQKSQRSPAAASFFAGYTTTAI